MRILQVTPTIYSRHSVIGGGEKGVLYVDRALNTAGAAQRRAIETAVLALGAPSDDTPTNGGPTYLLVAGEPWKPETIDANKLVSAMRDWDVIYVHQCLAPIGMFVASHARLLGKSTMGVDSGGGEHRLLSSNPGLLDIYDSLHAQSRFAQECLRSFDVPIRLIKGPMDTDAFVPSNRNRRDRKHVVAVGRLLPHKGFERIIRALPDSLTLTIAGQPYDQDYVAFLQTLSAGKDVHLRSDLEDSDIRLLLQRAGLFIHASTHWDYNGHFSHKPELLGLAPLEALSCGLMTFVSNAGALPELAELPGCFCFENDIRLQEMMNAFAVGDLPEADQGVLHHAVEEHYGLLSFGRQLLSAFDDILA